MEAAMNINKELVGASTSMLILSVLADKPNYGYEIVKSINEMAGDVYTWQEGTIYPVLRKLEKEGILRSQWETADNGKKRKYYYITVKGREAMTEGAREWSGFFSLVMKRSEAWGV